MPATGRLMLTPSAPVVSLSRLVSGIGTLTVQAAVTSGVDGLLLGCGYALADGTSSFLRPDGESRVAPPGSRVPVLTSGRDRYPHVTLDLRRIRTLTRALFVLGTTTRLPATWAGALLITTHSGAQISVPLETVTEPAVALAAVSLHQVDGEIVLRSELDPATSLREACALFGYDAIAWLDDQQVIA